MCGIIETRVSTRGAGDLELKDSATCCDGLPCVIAGLYNESMHDLPLSQSAIYYVGGARVYGVCDVCIMIIEVSVVNVVSLVSGVCVSVLSGSSVCGVCIDIKRGKPCAGSSYKE
jgi:hypothetical protein